nr:MAG TPA: hypothetical protein [Caudoviricetes sp.]
MDLQIVALLTEFVEYFRVFAMLFALMCLFVVVAVCTGR